MFKSVNIIFNAVNYKNSPGYGYGYAYGYGKEGYYGVSSAKKGLFKRIFSS